MAIIQVPEVTYLESYVYIKNVDVEALQAGRLPSQIQKQIIKWVRDLMVRYGHQYSYKFAALNYKVQPAPLADEAPPIEGRNRVDISMECFIESREES